MRASVVARLTAGVGVTGVVAGSLLLTAPADAQPTDVVTASTAVDRVCHEALATGDGVDTTTVTAPTSGLVEARLSGTDGDWDVAVFDASGESVAASAGSASNELAEGFVTAGDELTVQACRVEGGASSANLGLTFLEITPTADDADPVQVVEVATPERADKERLQALDLDLTEHGDADSLEVVLHDAADEQALVDAGFTYEVRVADLAAQSVADAAADETYAATVAASDLPSGRTEYRRLADYEAEMKALADSYPDLVRPITLNNPTVEGRDVQGIEITTDAANIADGKPVFLHMGVHHAREWPAGEHTMEWAYDLLTGYGTDARATELVETTRSIVVPIVNPDGFTISREAAPLGDFSQFDYEMKRKNCSISVNTPERFRTGTCADNPAGRLRGTDPNRNYGGFWGGPGASTNWSSDTYRGDAPFSEPEVQNIRELVSGRQVTNLITNHTFANLVLRPPGVAATRAPLDEPQYAALGASMAEANQYDSIPSYGLYDTTGGTEDWTFWSTGGLGFTYEIGTEGFHPPFEVGVVAEYLGLEPAEGAGLGGNQEAYYRMAEATADRSLHSLITGTAPAGHTLTLRKEFQTATSPVIQPDGTVSEPILFEDVLESTYRSDGGRFEWDVNPSTRPVVAGRYGRDPVAPPQEATTLENPAGIPAENQGNPVAGPNEVIPFTIEGPPDADNGTATIRIEWADPNTDWDVYILNADGAVVGQAASFGTNFEAAVLTDPVPGEYTAVVVNYDGGDPDDWGNGSVTFASPLPAEYGEKEAWMLTCTSRSGAVRLTQEVVVDRGGAVDVGQACRPQRPRG